MTIQTAIDLLTADRDLCVREADDESSPPEYRMMARCKANAFARAIGFIESVREEAGS